MCSTQKRTNRVIHFLTIVEANITHKMSRSDAYKNETLKHVSKMYLIKAIMEGRWDDACSIVYNDESFALIPDNDGYLPLHLSVKLGCPSRLAVLLITAHPESIRLKDRDGFYPLHLAVRHHKCAQT